MPAASSDSKRIEAGHLPPRFWTAVYTLTHEMCAVFPFLPVYTAEAHPARLVVSWTTADPRQRLELLPVEKGNSTPELLQALRDYHAVSGQRVTLAWTMMSGMNCREEDVRKLADLTRGLPIKLDLIDVNDPTGRFQPPSRAELDAFRDALRKHLAMPVARRYSGGQDIHADCGMLAGCTNESRHESPA